MLRVDLKFSRDDDFHISSGSLFHGVELVRQNVRMISGETQVYQEITDFMIKELWMAY